MSKQRVFLVIGADKRIRAAKRPQLRVDEIAIAIDLQFPDTWGRVITAIEVAVPDFAPTVAVPDVSADG
jgi:hypothetical protein